MPALKKGLIFIGIFIALLITALYIFQEKLIFLPSDLPTDYAYSFESPFEEIFLNAEDGARLNAVYFEVENPKGVLLYFHGNAGNLARWGEITNFFKQFDYNILVMDYRTYGKSTGTLSEKALFDDAQLFYAYLKKSWPENQIVVYGRSLGTSIATYIASENTPKKLILESPFYNMSELANSRYPFLPTKYLLKYNFNTNDFMEHVRCPVMILHGSNDDIVPFESGQKLSKLLPPGQLEFILIPEGSHNNLVTFSEYQLAIQHFLQK